MAEKSRAEIAVFFGAFVVVAVLATTLLQTGFFQKTTAPANAGSDSLNTDVETLVNDYKNEALRNPGRARKMFSGRPVTLVGTVKRIEIGSILLGGESTQIRVDMRDDLTPISVSDTVRIQGKTSVLFLESLMREIPALTVRGGHFVK